MIKKIGIVICEKCGAKSPENEIFCSKCGNRFAENQKIINEKNPSTKNRQATFLIILSFILMFATVFSLLFDETELDSVTSPYLIPFIVSAVFAVFLIVFLVLAIKKVSMGSKGKIRIAISCIPIIIIIGFTVLFGLATNNTSTHYYQLSDSGKLFVDRISISIDNFKAPETVDIRELAYDSADDIFYARISAQNGFGGNTIDYYIIDQNGYIFQEDSAGAMLMIYTKFSENELNCINEAIHEK